MTYWRMQLHPFQPERAVAHTMKSLGLGYIGLDFSDPPGDLSDVARSDIPAAQRDYWDFAHSMKVGDQVLVIAHHLCNQKKCCVLVFSLCNGSEATLIMLRNGTPELRIAGSRVSQVGHRTGFTRSFMPWMTESLPRSISSNSDIRAWSR